MNELQLLNDQASIRSSNSGRAFCILSSYLHFIYNPLHNKKKNRQFSFFLKKQKLNENNEHKKRFVFCFNCVHRRKVYLKDKIVLKVTVFFFFISMSSSSAICTFFLQILQNLKRTYGCGLFYIFDALDNKVQLFSCCCCSCSGYFFVCYYVCVCFEGGGILSF